MARPLRIEYTDAFYQGYLHKPDGPELAFVGFGLDWRVHCQQDFLLSSFQGNKMSTELRLYFPTDL